MKAGIKIKGIDGVIKNIATFERSLTKATIESLTEGAKLVQGTAKQYAPLDKGPLEDSIKTHKEIRSGGATISVYVDENDPTDIPGKTVGDYAIQMHEGDYNLGDKSLEKAAALGVEVGAKYMERALDDKEKEILKAMRRTLEKTLKR